MGWGVGVAGIYVIENCINGKCYIGSSVNARRRISQHISSLHNGKHHNHHLQASWYKYGEDAFSFAIIKECPKSDLLKWEQAFLSEWKPEYNNTLIADRPQPLKGWHHTPERIEQMRAASTGRKYPNRKPQSEEARARAIAATRGKKRSPEAVEKTAAANRNRSSESRAKTAASVKISWLIRRTKGVKP